MGERIRKYNPANSPAIMKQAKPSPTKNKSPRAALLQGAVDTFPLLVGAWPFGLIFGALAVGEGLSPLAAVAMSIFVFAGSSQFIALGLIGAGAPLAVIVVTTFIVNLRHALYSATLAPHLKKLPLRWLVPLGFWLTDESFVLASHHFEKDVPAKSKPWYLLGTELTMYFDWLAVTILGVLVGQQIKDPQSWGLDFAMAITFIGMLVPMVKDRPILLAVLVAGSVAVLANGLPNQLGLLLAALLGIAAGVLAESILPGSETAL
jgi:4-azaleucine resistance transporter AzlC